MDDLDRCGAMSLEELVRSCAANGDNAVWSEFVRRFHPLIAIVASRIARRWGDPSPSTVDDLVQETYLKLCADRQRLLARFEPRREDAFYGYLKVVTANVVHDHFRAAHTEKRGSERTQSLEAQLEEPVASKRGTAEEIHRSVLMEEIDVMLRSDIAPRDRVIFWLFYRQGMTAQAIADLSGFDLTVKGVESVVYRLTRVVRERMTPDLELT